MTIDNLEAIVSPSSEDLLLIRHGGKEWKYPLSTLASNLINDPTISATTLGTASHPFETANITTLNVGGSGTVNGNLTVQATTDTAEASLLKVEKTLTVNGYATVNGNVQAGSLIVASDLKVDNLTGPVSDDGTYRDIAQVIVSKTLDVNALNVPDATLTVTGSGNIKTTSITTSELSSLTVTDSITAKALSMTSGTLTIKSDGKVTVGSSESGSSLDTSTKINNKGITIGADSVLELKCGGTFSATDLSDIDTLIELAKDESFEDPELGDYAGEKYALFSRGSIVCLSPIAGEKVFNAVWNDLADCIPVNKEAVIEPGYCYCFDGEKYYKSTKYLEKGIIGIESDTYGMHMGSKPGVKQMDVAVSGFALAYVDKEYESGTPLTCTENGYLTEIAKQDKIEYPERIVGTYWKPEPNEEWGSSDRKVKVNGRHWIKIK